MKHATALVVVLAVLAAPAAPLACGDKFLVPSRGARFQILKVDRGEAAVLLYAAPGSRLGRTLASGSVDASLRKAGYRPVLVASEADLKAALTRQRWDIVVLDLGDPAAQLAVFAPTDATADRLEPRPVVLPVAHELSRSDLAAARRQYRQILNAAAKPSAFVDAVDHLLRSRLAAVRRSEKGTLP